VKIVGHESLDRTTTTGLPGVEVGFFFFLVIGEEKLELASPVGSPAVELGEVRR
jgi:hypothetical protein